MSDTNLEVDVAQNRNEIVNIKGQLGDINESLKHITNLVQKKNENNWTMLAVLLGFFTSLIGGLGYLSLEPTRQALLTINRKYEAHTAKDMQKVAKNRLDTLEKSIDRTVSDIKSQAEALDHASEQRHTDAVKALNEMSKRLSQSDVDMDTRLQGEIKTATMLNQKSFEREIKFIIESQLRTEKKIHDIEKQIYKGK